MNNEKGRLLICNLPFFVVLYDILFLQKLLTHIERSLSTISHCEDYGGTTSYDVAASIDFLNRALHLVIYGNRILSAKFQSLNALRNEWVRAYANSYDYLVALQSDGRL